MKKTMIFGILAVLMISMVSALDMIITDENDNQMELGNNQYYYYRVYQSLAIEEDILLTGLKIMPEIY